jgi:hypothetical protein
MGKKHDQSGRYNGTCEKVEVAMGWTHSEKIGWQMDAINTRMVSEMM